MKKAAAITALLLILIVVLAISIGRLSTHAENVGLATSSSARSTNLPQAPLETRNAPAQREPVNVPVVSSIIVRIVDGPTGLPVSGAAVMSARTYNRHLGAEDTTTLGISDTEGNIYLGSIPVAARMGVIAKNYSPKVLASQVLLDGFETVSLTPGYEIVATCLTPDGIPLQGCKVRASLKQLPSQLDEAYKGPDALPGFDDSRVHSGTTDETGMAVLAGLCIGAYDIDVVHNGLALFDIKELSPEGILVPDTKTVVVILKPLVAAAYETPMDSIVGTAYSYPLHIHNTLPLASMERAARMLQVRFPKANIAVFPENPETSSSLSVMAMLRDRGVVSFDVPLQRLDDIDAPTMVDLSKHEPRDVCHPTRVRLENLDGSKIPDAGLYLRVGLGSSLASSIEIPLKEGTQWLPSGTHSVLSWNPALEHAFEPQSITIPEEEEVVLRLQRQFRACRLLICDPAGNRHDRYTVSIRTDGKRYSQIVSADVPQPNWFATGSAGIAVKVWGYPELKANPEIQEGEGVYEIKLVLEEQRTE